MGALVTVSIIAISCGGADTKQSTTTVASTDPAVVMPADDTTTDATTVATSENPPYDPNRGAGKFVDDAPSSEKYFGKSKGSGYCR